VALAALALAGVASPAARADDDAQKAAAKAKLGEGARLLESGDYAPALEKFQEAYRLVPSPKIFYNIGLADVGLARYPDALRAFERFVAEASNAAPATLAEARGQIENLRAKVALVDVECSEKGTEIIVDGRSHGKTPLAETIYLDPGEHRLLAQASEGAAPVIQVFTTTGGTRQTIKVVYPTIPVTTDGGGKRGGPVLVGGGGGTRPSGEERPYYQSPWFWGAVGGAVVAAAVVTLLLAGGSTNYPNPSLGRFQGN
jgi:hypothetical protein